jgi:redox-regulated HSP33 family molecular chaperone
MNYNTSAQCYTENGEVFMTDQSGNGHHLKRNKMKNTLKPLPSFEVDTPRTDEVRHNVAELAMHSRKLERELAELRKDRERLDWLIDNNCEIYEPGTALLYCDCDRESIDEMMPQATR